MASPWLQDEYVTRHKLDGTIIYADHRIGTVTGHLPHEVVGVSAHKYMEPSDVVIALFAQKQSEWSFVKLCVGGEIQNSVVDSQ